MVTWLKFGIVASLLLTTRAVGQTLDEYQVKAAFIVKFAGFVEWPPSAFKNPADPLVICVMGRNPFGHQIENMVEGNPLMDEPSPCAPSPTAGMRSPAISCLSVHRNNGVLAPFWTS